MRRNYTAITMQEHYTYKSPRPTVAKGCVIFGCNESSIKVLLIQHCIKERICFEHNFSNKLLKLGILAEAEPRPKGAPSRFPNKYRFNPKWYID